VEVEVLLQPLEVEVAAAAVALQLLLNQYTQPIYYLISFTYILHQVELLAQEAHRQLQAVQAR
jgi:hypothetical protein